MKKLERESQIMLQEMLKQKDREYNKRERELKKQYEDKENMWGSDLAKLSNELQKWQGRRKKLK